MNSFLNPYFSFKILKHYTSDINRVWTKKPEELKKYKDKALKKAVTYAYKTPVYHELYKKEGIHPNDIRGMKDIDKLPLISKNTISKAYPNKIMRKKTKLKKLYQVSTSGSTNEPLTIYKDMESIIIEHLSGIRMVRALGLDWRRSRIANIGDFTIANTSDFECLQNGLFKNLSLFLKLNNYQNICTSYKIKDIYEYLNKFKPDLIIGYTSVLLGLASNIKNIQKNKISPKYIVSSGEILDPYSRHYIENSFDTKVLDLYAATEGGNIAFECSRNGFHLNSDFVHTEILDEQGEKVGYNKLGNVVITKLSRYGTPFIRYTGLNDVAMIDDKTCDCKINTPILKSLEGRKRDIIITPDGRIIPPATIPIPIFKSANKLNMYNIKKIQFVQKKLDHLEVRLEVEEEIKEKIKKIETLIDDIKKRYKKFLNNSMSIEVNIVTDIEILLNENSPRLVISNIENKY